MFLPIRMKHIILASLPIVFIAEKFSVSCSIVRTTQWMIFVRRSDYSEKYETTGISLSAVNTLMGKHAMVWLPMWGSTHRHLSQKKTNKFKIVESVWHVVWFESSVKARTWIELPWRWIGSVTYLGWRILPVYVGRDISTLVKLASQIFHSLIIQPYSGETR